MSRSPWSTAIRVAARAASAVAVAMAMALLVIPAAPAAAATGSVTTTATYSVDFKTSGQNMWGSGTNTAPSSATIPIIPTQNWGPTQGSANNIVTSGSFDSNLDYDSTVCSLDTDSDCRNQNDWGCILRICADSNLDIDGFSLDTDGDSGSNDTDRTAAQFGGNISGSTSGSIGVSLNVAGLSSGTVAVNYPVQVTEKITQPGRYLKPGDKVTIVSDWTVQSGYGITTQSSQGTVGMSGKFAFSASASGTICVVFCGSFNIFPSVNIPSTSGTIIPSFGPNAAIPAFGTGVSGQIGSPQFGVSSTKVASNGKSLVATGSDDFWNVSLDLAKVIGKITGVPIAAGTPTVDGVGFNYDLLTAVPNPNYQSTQKLTFAPTVLETLTFPVAVAYTAYASDGSVYGAATAKHVVFPADGRVQITVPNVASGPLSFAPSFSLADNTFSNQSGFKLNWSLGVKALTASASFSNAGSFNLGPIEQYQTPTASVSFPVTGSGSRFGLDTGSWPLAGFNGATGSTGQLLVDSVAPTTVGSLTGPQGTNGWFVGPTQFNLSATDDYSGVASTWWSVNDGAFQAWPGVAQSFTADGKYKLAYYSIDNAGNVEAVQHLQLNLDQTPPQTTAKVGGTPGTNGWWKAGSPATLTLRATDNLSGVAQTLYQVRDAATGADIGGLQTYAGSPVTFPDGRYSVLYYSVDNAGNVEAAHTIAFNVDQTPPVTTASVSGTLGTNGWWKAGRQVTLTLHATDNLSGVASTSYQVTDQTTGVTGSWQTYSAPVVFADGVYTVSYFSVDQAGNIESAKTIAFKVDQTPPSITLASRQPAANGYGWNSGSVTVTWDCADALSGPASPTVAQTLSGQGAGQTAKGTCTDQAGNTTSASLGGINIELKPPTLAYTGNQGTYTVDQTVAISCDLTPSLAPIVTDTCTPIQGPAYSFPLGVHTYTSSVSDQAGYSADATTTFTVEVTAASLCHLTGMFESKPGLARALCAKLDNAAAIASGGNGHPTQNMIVAYEHEVAAQRGKSLTTAQAQILMSLAQSLAAQYA